MGNPLRNILAAVLSGPANIMAAYRTIVEKFGDNAEAAADYVWEVHNFPMAKRAAKKYTWYPPSHKFEDDPVHPKEPGEWWSTKPIAPRSVSLQDAAETVARGLVSEEGLRGLYADHFTNYFEVDERGKEIVVERFIEDMTSMPKQTLQKIGVPIEQPFNDTELGDFKQKFVKATSAMKSQDRIYAVFKELIFKTVFVKMYKAMRTRLGSGTSSKWAYDSSLMCAVVARFVESI